jgi:hypothetical protein
LSERLFLASGPVHHRAVADIHLSHILGHPVTLELFKDSLTRPSAQAHLALWMDVQRWRGLEEGGQARRMVAEGMVQMFLVETRGGGSAPPGTQPLSTVSQATKNAINQCLLSGNLPKTMFDAVESEMLYQLSKEMQSFSGTTAFKIAALILGHSAYTPDTKLQSTVLQKAVAPQSAMTGAITAVKSKKSSLNNQELSLQSDHVGPSLLAAGGNGVQIHLYADGTDSPSASPQPVSRRVSGAGAKQLTLQPTSPSHDAALASSPLNGHGSVEMTLMSPTAGGTSSQPASPSPLASTSCPLGAHQHTASSRDDLASPSNKH